MATELILRCLHGFLGQESDFAFLRNALERRHPKAQARTMDLWSRAKQPLEAVAQTLRNLSQPGEVVLGYSMGGRLALQAFLHPDSMHEALVAISARPTGLSPAEAALRVDHDERWARRFESDDWDSVMLDWNRLDVFDGGKSIPARAEAAFDRACLASVLRNWSPAHQPDLLPQLRRESRPILWLTGHRDQKYSQTAALVGSLNPQIRVRTVPEAGHRIPWDNPDYLVDEIDNFLATLPSWQSQATKLR